MSFTSDLEAIDRIITMVKTCRNQKKNHYKPVDNERVTAYLKRHLSLADWLVWQRACGGQRVRLLADGMGYA